MSAGMGAIGMGKQAGGPAFFYAQGEIGKVDT